jgi:uncharacterized membrane protein YdjX (TVP38/TMEM64 family)
MPYLCTMFSQNKIASLYTVFTAVAPVALSGIASYIMYKYEANLMALNTLELAGLTLVCSLAMGLALIPTSFVSLAAGYFWGYWAIPSLLVSYLLATCIGYYLGKVFNVKSLYNYLSEKPKAKNLMQNISSKPFAVILLARLSPVFPFGVSNVIFTFLGIPLQTLLVGGIIGMLPRSFVLLLVGKNAGNLKEAFTTQQFSILSSTIAWLGILATFVLCAFLFYTYKKKTNNT